MGLELARVSGLYSIRTKLTLIGAAVMLIVLGLLVAGDRGVSILKDSQTLEESLERSHDALQLALRGINELMLTGGAGVSRSAVDKALADYDRAMENTLATLSGTQFAQSLDAEVAPHVAELKKHYARLKEYPEGGLSPGDADAALTYSLAVDNGDRATEHFDQTHMAVMEDAKARADRILIGLSAGAALSIVLLVVLFILLYYSIVSPIRQVARFSAMVADGDFSARLPAERKDEIGAIAKDLAAMSNTLKSALGRVKEASGRLAANVAEATAEAASGGARVQNALAVYDSELARAVADSARLSAVTDEVGLKCDELKVLATQTSHSIETIVTTVERVSGGALAHSTAASGVAEEVNRMLAAVDGISGSLQSLAAATTEAAAAITQMQHTVRDVSEKSRESATAAVKTSETATAKGLDAVAGAEGGIERIYRSVESLAQTIQRQEERSRNIANIVNVIEDIASQTSLLALNASILAAQAGARGEAFAVVANEVKALASRIALSTGEIEKVIKEATADTRASVALSRDGLGAAREGIELVRTVRGALEEIRGRADSSADLSAQIERAMREQAVGATQIAQTVNNIAMEVEVVSTSASEVSAGGHHILREMEGIKEGSLAITRQTAAQKRDSLLILDAARAISGNAVDIAARVAEAKDSNANVAESVANLHSSTIELAGNISALADSLARLEKETGGVVEEIGKFAV